MAPFPSALAAQLAAWILLLGSSPARADWWGSVGGAVSGAFDQAQQAGTAAASKAQEAAEQATAASIVVTDSSVAHQLRGGGLFVLERAENMTGDAIEQAKDAACDMRVGQNIAEANHTMFSQLNLDCEATASEVSLVHDQLLDTCLSVGLWNIDRTLEAQRAAQKAECIEALNMAGDGLTSALDAWGQKSRSVLEGQMQSTIQGAIEKARETVGDAKEPEDRDAYEDLMLVAERKFSATAVVPEGEPAAAAPPLAGKSLLQLAVPLLLAGAAAVAVRRSAPRTGDALLLSEEPLD